MFRVALTTNSLSLHISISLSCSLSLCIWLMYVLTFLAMHRHRHIHAVDYMPPPSLLLGSGAYVLSRLKTFCWAVSPIRIGVQVFLRERAERQHGEVWRVSSEMPWVPTLVPTPRLCLAAWASPWLFSHLSTSDDNICLACFTYQMRNRN